MLAIILLVFGVLTRLIVHEPNFTPILAVALFSGVYLNKRYAVILPVALMILADLFLGLHETILYTWGSMAIIAALGLWIKTRKSFALIFGGSIASAVLFFIVTNFGVWLTGLYPNTLAGLIQCFSLAIPFFRNTLVSTLVYSTALFGLYEYIALRVKDTRLAHALLTN
ncbi:MAG: DUF6580 family putative transport protein [Candidatus Omnitrophota bacterium]